MLKIKESTIIEPISAENIDVKSDAAVETKTKACELATNDLIQNFWDLIAQTTSLSSTVEVELEDGAEEIKTILTAIIDDITVDIGMLYKIIELLNAKTPALIAAGQEKAEEVIDDANTEESQETIDSAEEESEEEKAD